MASLSGASAAVSLPKCACSDASLCKPLPGKRVAEEETFLFSVDSEANAADYPYAEITTLALAGYRTASPDGVVCRAHANKTRVVLLTSMAKADVANASARASFVADTVKGVVEAGFDGVNVDFEDYVLPGETSVRDGLIALTKELRVAMDEAERTAGGSLQLSWDFAWSPDGLAGHCGIDERCYPYAELADIVDVGFVMSYDMQSQVFGPGPCRAGANSPFKLVAEGLRNWTKVADPSKLVLGLPFYGYRYECLDGTDPLGELCRINTTLWRNATCSDAVGREHDAAEILSWLPSSSTGWKWDRDARSPWFNLVNETTKAVSQVRFDNPGSLALKASLAGDAGLLGTGSWEIDSLLSGAGVAGAIEYIRALKAV